MPINYQVRQGDCISSIAFEHGFFADTIWNHPNNAELKKKRKDPNILMPGDTVFIPDKRIKEVSEPTNNVHKFRCKNTPEKFKMQLLLANEPRAGEKYEMEIGDLKFSGVTDSEGRFSHFIPPDAREGKLFLSQGKEVYSLQIGSLNPSDEITGAKGRLSNLGVYAGAIDGKSPEEWEAVVQEFQFAQNLEPDGELTSATLAAIKQEYGT